MPRTFRLALSASLLGLSGCAVSPAPQEVVEVEIATAARPDHGICHLAELRGTLVADREFGLVVGGHDPAVSPAVVVWPHGYRAGDVAGVRVLFDASGAIVARVGDTISSAGGQSAAADERFHACGTVTVVPPP